MSNGEADAPRHPIQVVARRTGLTPDVLRAWERRYQAVTPHRTDTSRRLYSDHDVERLILLRSVTSAGRPISQVAPLSIEELRGLAHEDTRALAVSPAPSARGGSGDGNAVGQALNAVSGLDSDRLRAVLANASLTKARSAVLSELLVPLVEEIGNGWHAGTLRIAHEHLATAVIQSFLSDLLKNSGTETAPLVIVGTPLGQRHQLGALMAATTALNEGWQVTYLGADLPAEELAAAAVQRLASAVALSLVYPPDDPMLPGELRTLRDLLPASASILVGGRAASAYQPVLDELGLVSLATLPQLSEYLTNARRGET